MAAAASRRLATRARARFRILRFRRSLASSFVPPVDSLLVLLVLLLLLLLLLASLPGTLRRPPFAPPTRANKGATLKRLERWRQASGHL